MRTIHVYRRRDGSLYVVTEFNVNGRRVAKGHELTPGYEGEREIWPDWTDKCVAIIGATFLDDLIKSPDPMKFIMEIEP